MTDPPPARRRNTDTTAARRASRAKFARRRHERWIQELRAAGAIVILTPEYTGLPLDEPPEPAPSQES